MVGGSDALLPVRAPVDPTIVLREEWGIGYYWGSTSAVPPTFLSSSMVEHPAVNRRVAGSNPA
jgi:hypothetical protein